MTRPGSSTLPATRLDRVLGGIERAGNRLPEPFILFVGLLLVVAVVSTAMAAAGVSVIVPGAAEPTVVRGAFTGEGIAFLFTGLASNFINFPPLQAVVTIMLGVGLAERTGMLTSLIRAAFARAPRSLLGYAVGLVGVTGSVMSDSVFIILPPLAALVFRAAGRHPVAGLIGGFAAAGAGYSTSLLVTALDALFAGITTAVTETLPNAGTPVTAVSNYVFNAVSAVVLIVIAGLVIDRVVEPSLVRGNFPTVERARPGVMPGTVVDDRGPASATEGGVPGGAAAGAADRAADRAADGARPVVADSPAGSTGGPDPTHRSDEGPTAAPDTADADADTDTAAREARATLTDTERRGLRHAGVAFAVLAAVLLTLTLVPGSPMRGENGGFLPDSPLLDSVITLVFLAFFVPALAYGRATGAISRAADVPVMMGRALMDLAGFIVLAFVLGQFIALFNWTNLASWLAVSGANLLETIGLTGYPAILGFIVLASLLNLFIISGSSLWTLLAAVFVPLFVFLGFEPGFIQAAFRVGDSATQVMTPLNPYMIVLLAFVRRYDPSAGLGTVIAKMVPFVVPFWLAWVAVLSLFYAFDWPLGPGQGIFLTP